MTIRRQVTKQSCVSLNEAKGSIFRTVVPSGREVRRLSMLPMVSTLLCGPKVAALT